MDIKILMLEDSESDVEFIGRALDKEKIKFIGKRVETEEDFVSSLTDFNPDVILSDHNLPQFNSLTALKLAKKIKPDVPFILVTGTVSEEFAVTCIKSGADDYILKSNLARLPSAIINSYTKKGLESENAIIKRLNLEIEKKNEELHEKNIKLFSLNQEQDRFMGIASHDIKNQLASMLFTIGLFKETEVNLNDKQQIYLKRLSQSTANMERLISDFLTINRLQGGIVQPDYESINISDLIRQIIYEYEEIAAKKNIKIEYTDYTDNSVYLTDKNYLGIIFGNLISNAIKYNYPNKMVYITLSKEGSSFRVKVKDEGQGIGPSEIPKMYGRFQKLGSTPTGGEPSTGLGLSIVRDLVNVLSGSIKCKSEPGQGTEFEIIL